MSSEAAKTLIAVVAAAALSSACEKPVVIAAPPPEVYVVGVVQKDVPTYLDLVGQTEGTQDVDVRARVEGFLESMNFREGSFVRKGSLLYRIDRKPFETSVAAAKADKATAEARLPQTHKHHPPHTPPGG